jgi:Fe-S-cluster-containing dehydrogenase component
VWGTGTAPASVAAPWIAALVKDLHAHHGASVVIAGDQQPSAVHALALAMNHALGNIGTTVTLTAPVEARASEQDAALRGLVADMAAKKVDLLFVLEANPVYAAPADLDVAAAFDAVKLRVHMGLFDDETADVCHWHVPTTHFLESWGDTRAFDGTVTICQPLIAPLYDGHSALECLSVLNGHPDKTSYDIVHEFWMAQWGNRANATFGTLARTDGASEATFESFFRRAVHDGYVAGSALPAVTATVTPAGVPAAGAAVSGRRGGVPARCRRCSDGRFANNGWLHGAAASPVTKLTWDNAALVSPEDGEAAWCRARARMLKIALGERQARCAGACGCVPWPAGRVHHVGHSATAATRAGRVGSGVGRGRRRRLRTSRVPWWHGARRSRSCSGPAHQYRLACRRRGTTAMEGRRARAQGERSRRLRGTSPSSRSTWRTIRAEGHDDLPRLAVRGLRLGHGDRPEQACTGCNACVMACQAENNIPVVGKEQVSCAAARCTGSGSTATTRAIRQPRVDPPAGALPCIARRRRAKWSAPSRRRSTATKASTRWSTTAASARGTARTTAPTRSAASTSSSTPTGHRRRVLKMRNPDVTVRSRGVMEKCTYCVQRINLARIGGEEAKTGRSRDGEIVTACQQACPSQAIVFGEHQRQREPRAKMKAGRPQLRRSRISTPARGRPTWRRLRNPQPGSGACLAKA